MVKANSLLYAIYVCLIVSILCGALLYIATMYNQLNLYYVTRQDLYIHNQSLVNFAMGNIATPSVLPDDDENGIQSLYEVKQFGLIPVVITQSFIKNDTVASAHFAGQVTDDKTALYLTNMGKPLSYSGTVKIIGDKKLPDTYIKDVYIENKPNVLEADGMIQISEPILPLPNKFVKKGYPDVKAVTVSLKEFPKKDSLYYNSFLKPSLQLYLKEPVLANINLKGNIIIRSGDSITVKKTAHLEDVILIAPKITFEEGFSGNLQAFTTEGIIVNSNVTLSYPSVLYMFNASMVKCTIKIKSNSTIYGNIILYGNAPENIKYNSIDIEAESNLYCNIYCTGSLIVKSNIYGSVYTNKFLHITPASGYDNCIANITINPSKKPGYYINLPLFDTGKSYGPIKKVI